MQLTLLDPFRPNQPFPPLSKALSDPNGLIAAGGCLTPERILNAYHNGIFPWYNQGEPILWWSPDPRLVLFPDRIKISRSLRKTIRKKRFLITFDTAFEQVMDNCANPRPDQAGTWITSDIKKAYSTLFQLGYAHSAEAWSDNELVGGLYGIAIGQVFFGESMFHTRTDASKVAFVALVAQLQCWQYQILDCQVQTQHLLSLGAEEISRKTFIHCLNQYCNQAPSPSAWNAQ